MKPNFLQKSSSTFSRNCSTKLFQHQPLHLLALIMWYIKVNLQLPSSTQHELSNSWIVDSRASYHMVGNLQFFAHFSSRKDSHTICIVNGSYSQVAGYGSVQLTPNIFMKSVLLSHRWVRSTATSNAQLNSLLILVFFRNCIEKDDWQCWALWRIVSPEDECFQKKLEQ